MPIGCQRECSMEDCALKEMKSKTILNSLKPGWNCINYRALANCPFLMATSFLQLLLRCIYIQCPMLGLSGFLSPVSLHFNVRNATVQLGMIVPDPRAGGGVVNRD